jgi:hypothetical protein
MSTAQRIFQGAGSVTLFVLFVLCTSNALHGVPMDAALAIGTIVAFLALSVRCISFFNSRSRERTNPSAESNRKLLATALGVPTPANHYFVWEVRSRLCNNMLETV